MKRKPEEEIGLLRAILQQIAKTSDDPVLKALIDTYISDPPLRLASGALAINVKEKTERAEEWIPDEEWGPV